MIYSDYITGVFIPQITQFNKMFSETVFPPFADPEAQANKIAQDYWDKKMSEPVGEFGPDEDRGDIADDAHQKSIDFYETMTAMQHRREPVHGRRVPPVRAAGRHVAGELERQTAEVPVRRVRQVGI
jgi:hypothetical protein